MKVDDRVLAGFGWQRERQAAAPADGDQRRRADRLARLRRPARPRSRPSARTSPTTSRRRSPSSPTRRSTASARSSTSRPAPCSGAARRSTAPSPTRRTLETAFPVILGGAPRHGAALATADLPPRSPASTRPTCSRTSGRSSADRPRRSTSALLESETDAGRDRAPQAGGRRRRCATAPSCSCSPTAPSTTASAATSTRTSRLAAIDQALQRVPGRGRRGEPAPRAARSCCARRRSATSTTSMRRARPRRQRRLPVRDGRGRSASTTTSSDVSNLCAAPAQGDREGDLDDRHPRGARLRAPVLLDRGQARARSRSSQHRASAPRERARRSASPSSTRDAERAPRRSSPARRTRQAGEDVPLLPEGLQGRDRAPPTASAATRSTRRRSASSRREQPDLDAPHHEPAADRAGATASRPARSTLGVGPPRLPDRDHAR